VAREKQGADNAATHALVLAVGVSAILMSRTDTGYGWFNPIPEKDNGDPPNCMPAGK